MKCIPSFEIVGIPVCRPVYMRKAGLAKRAVLLNWANFQVVSIWQAGWPSACF